MINYETVFPESYERVLLNLNCLGFFSDSIWQRLNDMIKQNHHLTLDEIVFKVPRYEQVAEPADGDSYILNCYELMDGVGRLKEYRQYKAEHGDISKELVMCVIGNEIPFFKTE